MYRTIVVPLDGSSFAEHALPLAMSLAKRTKAKVQLVLVHVPLATVYAEPMLGFETALDPHLKEREQSYLASVVERVKKAAPLDVSTACPEGPVAEKIQEQVTAVDADLVVMTTHGRGPLGRFWMGSVADELVRQLAKPVVLVRPHDAEVDLAQEVVLRHLLIPLDGSALAEQVIEPAVALGSPTEAYYTLVRVVKPVMSVNIDYVYAPPMAEGQAMLEKLKGLHDKQVKAATEYLNQVSKPLQGRSLRVQARVITGDQPAVAILNEAASHGINLIAVATHGRRGLTRMVLGSVADKIVRGSTLPVLVYRPKDK